MRPSRCCARADLGQPGDRLLRSLSEDPLGANHVAYTGGFDAVQGRGGEDYCDLISQSGGQGDNYWTRHGVDPCGASAVTPISISFVQFVGAVSGTSTFSSAVNSPYLALISVGQPATRRLSPLRRRDARATRVGERQSALHETIRLVRGQAVSWRVGPRSRGRSAPRLAQGQGDGHALHARAVGGGRRAAPCRHRDGRHLDSHRPCGVQAPHPSRRPDLPHGAEVRVAVASSGSLADQAPRSEDAAGGEHASPHGLRADGTVRAIVGVPWRSVSSKDAPTRFA